MIKIKMMVGQQGPTLVRLPGQELTIGVDVGADEAQRLVDGHLAIEVRDANAAGEDLSTSTSSLAIAAGTTSTLTLEAQPDGSLALAGSGQIPGNLVVEGSDSSAPVTEPAPEAEPAPASEPAPEAEPAPVTEPAPEPQSAAAPAKRSRAKKPAAQD